MTPYEWIEQAAEKRSLKGIRQKAQGKRQKAKMRFSLLPSAFSLAVDTFLATC
jgi:hypothetical protein